MTSLLIYLALLIGQMITMQDEQVVHLRPGSDIIETGFNGKLLEINHGPAYVHLPIFPPKPDPQGNRWSIDIKNFGPSPIKVVDKFHFSEAVKANQTIHVVSNGVIYYLKH